MFCRCNGSIARSLDTRMPLERSESMYWLEPLATQPNHVPQPSPHASRGSVGEPSCEPPGELVRE